MNPAPLPCLLIRRCLLFILLLALISPASAEWKEQVLYSFQGGSDGYTPAGGVVFDKAGNLYGVNSWGGDSGCSSQGCGTVFQLAPPSHKGGSWTETVLYAFQGVNTGAGDGYTPSGSVIVDQQGNLYGTTSMGGTGPCIFFGSPAGCGIVYELSPPTLKGGQWTYTILYDFQGGNDGYFPWGDLVFDKQGNLYGATQFGGGRGTTCNLYYGGNCGTVFELSPPKQKGGKWTEKVLYRFAGGSDGANPNGGLILEGRAIYGTTFSGGVKNLTDDSGNVGYGTAFKLNPPTKKGGTWTEKQIHVFKDGNDGAQPAAGLVPDRKGSLFGTAGAGANSGVGVVYQLTRGRNGSWNETVLYEFVRNGGDGEVPQASLVFDSVGNLFSTTTYGGPRSLPRGNVFRLKPPHTKYGNWALNVLYNFKGSSDGAFPAASLILDKQGNLYSTTTQGGTGSCAGGCGTVFEVSPK